MRATEIRAAIIPALHQFVSVPVIESSQNGDVPEGPHFVYTFTSTDAAEGVAAVTYKAGVSKLTKTMEQDAQSVISLTVVVSSDEQGSTPAAKAEAYRLTDLAFDWFRFYGEDTMGDAGIALVNLSTITPRSGIDDGEYRRGFDITLRSRTRLSQDIDYFDKVVMTKEG